MDCGQDRLWRWKEMQTFLKKALIEVALTLLKSDSSPRNELTPQVISLECANR